MITRYRIVDSSGKEVADANDMQECEQILHHLREQNPHESYTIENYEISAVKPGFGRDPDLH
ncbi:MAG: hypothetical protein CMA64_06240 [Euryarchaeota archaeon]|nr:hypothetical protein [Euryarchaeota archaeon]